MKHGKCPYQPGELNSKVADTLEMSRLYGIWKIAYDEKHLNRNYTCMGAKLIPMLDLEHIKD